MASLTARRPTLTGGGEFALAELALAGGQRSPLDELELGVALRRDSLSQPSAYFNPKSPTTTATSHPLVAASNPPPIPSLNLNLFRSSSVYSASSESGESLSISSSDDPLDSPASYSYGLPSEPEPEADSEEVSDLDSDSEPIVFTTAPSTSRQNSPVGRNSPSTPRGRVADSPCRASGSTTPRGTRRATTTDTHSTPPHISHPYPFASVRSAISDEPFTLRDVPVRSARSLSASTSNATIVAPVTAVRSCSVPGPGHAPEPHDSLALYPETATAPDTASVHGEQGSDWGDDEAGFEWLDTDDAPAPGVGAGFPGSSTTQQHGALDGEHKTPSSSSARIRSAIAQPMLSVKRSVSIKRGEAVKARVESAKRSNSVKRSNSLKRSTSVKRSNSVTRSPTAATARTAELAQPPPSRSPLTPKVDLPNLSLVTDEPEAGPSRRKRHVVIPRRPAPPPPTGVAGFTAPVEPTRSRSPARPGPTIRTVAPAQRDGLPPVVIIEATPPRPGDRPEATMVPLKSGEDASSPSRHQSVQSLASSYSFYALDDTPPRSAVGPGPGPGSESEALRGRYAKVALPETPTGTPRRPSGGSAAHTNAEAGPSNSTGSLTRALGADIGRSRSSFSSDTGRLSAPGLGHAPGSGSGSAHSPSPPPVGRSPSLSTPMTPDQLLAAALERREAGDLPKSAWLFMRAAQGGSVPGRMFYGIALKHGYGIAKDERKAFTELSASVERALTLSAEAGADLRAAARLVVEGGPGPGAPGAGAAGVGVGVGAGVPGLGVALAELAGCYLEGVGTKRSAEVGVEYLRVAGGMGDVAVQEQLGHILAKGSGVKKDMREAARWYRAALGHGSRQPGLAWVWKEKYN